MANPIHNISENLNDSLNPFRKTLSIVLRNQRKLESIQMRMVKHQEKHFDVIRWDISSQFRNENNQTSHNIEEE